MDEVKIAQIHEAAETKRKLISEREETKRAKIAKRGFIPHIVLGATLLGSLLIGSCTIIHRENVKAEQTRPCIESAEIIGTADNARFCRGTAVMETQLLAANQVLIHCLCHERAKP